MIPQHVLTAFNASDPDAHATQLGPAWGNGLLVDTVVYSEAADTAHFSASLGEKLSVPGVRLARPVRSTDGRFIVGGWRAASYLSGQPERRYDETVLAAVRLADALSILPGPADLQRTDLYAEAEREAWQRGDEHFGVLDAPVQPGHADMLATTIYDGPAVPAVTEIVPFADPRPHAFTAALVIADAMIAEAEAGIDTGLMHRFGHLPDLHQLVVRAVFYREIIADRHPRGNSLTRSNVAAVRHALVPD